MLTLLLLVSAGASPPGDVVLDVPAVVRRGDEVTFTFSEAEANALVGLAGGPGQAVDDGGPCPAFMGADCVDITDLSAIRDRSPADGLGAGSFTVTLNPALPRVAMTAQMIAKGAGIDTSNTVSFQVVGCGDDVHEPNDNVGGAVVLPGTAVGSVCHDDADWFVAQLGPYEVLEVHLTHDETVGDIDLELLDANGVTLDWSQRSNGVEEITWLNNSASSTAAWLRVAAFYNPDRGPLDYAMVSFTDDTFQCIDDLNEDDDDASSARELPVETTLQGHACDADPDWFQVDVLDGNVLQVDLTVVDTRGDVRVRIRDENQSVVADGDNAAFYESPADQTLYIEAWLADDDSLLGGNDYAVTATVHPDAICQTDAHEPNNNPFAAPTITEGVHDLALCTDGEDWYTFSVLEGESVLANVFFGDNDGDINVELYDGTGDLLVRGTTTTSNEFVYTPPAPADDEMRLRVYLVSDAGLPTNDGVRYTLDLEIGD